MAGLLFGDNKKDEVTVYSGIRVQTSIMGKGIPIVFGTNRITGNLLDYVDFLATSSKDKDQDGGKGGLFKDSQGYNYSAVVLIGLCEGAVAGLGKVWGSKELTTLAEEGLTLILGDDVQTAWAYMLGSHPDHALAYRGICYVAGNVKLGSSAELTNYSFEVQGLRRFNPAGGIVDASVKDIITDLLTHSRFGAGFPATYLDSLTLLDTYCKAFGIFVSPAITEQREAAEILTDLSMVSNSQPVWSQGKLKWVPYGDESKTANGVTYVPPAAPLYDLNDADFLTSGNEDPVVLVRKDQADAFNKVTVEFLDRAHDYNADVEPAEDLCNIEDQGLRPMDPIQLHMICDRAVAKQVAQLVLQRKLYVRNEYHFTLGWKYCRLESMDEVTITDSLLGLDHVLVRIVEIEEDEDGQLKVIAEECPAGVQGATVYPTQTPDRLILDYNAPAGDVAAPVIFEPNELITGGALEIWLGVAGASSLYGGCEVWASEDGVTYERKGIITAPARVGQLMDPLPSSLVTPDLGHVLDVQLVRGSLLAGTTDDADRLNTLCYVDGELLAYRDATLTAPSRYDLGYLVRGAFYSGMGDHAAGSPFLRLDDAVTKIPFREDQVGKTLLLKFITFNVWGQGKQDLASVAPYSYTITGNALKTPLPDVTGLRYYYPDNRARLIWEPVDDVRPHDYEVRYGATWDTAVVLGRTGSCEFVCIQDGKYWVAAHRALGYSLNPISIDVTNAILTSNVVESYDEQATGWGGTLTGGAIISDGKLLLGGVGLFDAIPNLDAVPDLDLYGGVSSDGSYEVPAGHIVDIGQSAQCMVTCEYEVTNDPAVTSYTIQIALAGDDGVFGSWKDFVPGGYVGRLFKMRILMHSDDPAATVVFTKFTWTVDMPDLIDSGQGVWVTTDGLYIPFNVHFHKVPSVVVTIMDAWNTNEVAVVSTDWLTVNGFGVFCFSGMTPVTRRINWVAKSY